ncbi:MAG: 3D domain-containing protein [Fervidobacterium sp.]|uniref:3D domain-containing protein n=1 Tax=Fervidobacterium sp. TaxID=1871331 RepID=UPI004049C3E1
MARNKKIGTSFVGRILIIITLLMILNSCLPIGNYLELSMRIEDIQERVNKLERASAKPQPQPQTSDQQEIKQEIKNVDSKVAKLEQTVTSISNSIKSYNQELTKTSTKVSDLEKNLTSIKSDLDKISKTQTSIQNKVATLENQIKQIDVVRKDLDALSSQLRNVQQSIPTQINQTDIEFLKQLQQQISEIKATIQNLDPVSLLRLDTGYIYYIVKSGDTLSSIASAYKVSLSSLVELNNIADPSKLAVGQVVKIPVNDPKSYVKVPVKINPPDILSYHGQDKNGIRQIGMDIYARGKDIYPILPGKVLKVENNTVTVDHGNMIMAVYSGVNTSLKTGVFVSNDKPLGQCLDVFHFELYIEGEPRDPLRLFTEYKGIFTVTFYSEWDDGKVPTHPTFRIARNGRVPQQFLSIAVDPAVIPLGSLVYIPTLENTVFIAEDTGSAIKGNRIDVYVSDVRLALNQGITPHPVYIINPVTNR